MASRIDHLEGYVTNLMQVSQKLEMKNDENGENDENDENDENNENDIMSTHNSKL